MARSRLMSQTASGSLILTGPHQILSVEVSSSTIRLSLGDRPVFLPEDVAIAPADVIAEPVSLKKDQLFALRFFPKCGEGSTY